MTAVEVEGVVVVVVTVENLDSIDMQTVTGQVVLHPAAAVAEGNAADGDVAALDESQQVGAGDAFVVPRQFLEGTALSVNGPVAVNGYMTHLIGIDQLDGLRVRPQRHIVRFHRHIVAQTGTAIECRPLLKIEAHMALQPDRPCLVHTCRHDHPAAACSRTVVNRLLECHRAQDGRIRLGTIVHDVVVCRIDSRPSRHQE